MNVILKHLRQVEEGMSLLDQNEVTEVLRLLRACRSLGGTAYIFGNGGSAATSSHFANDLVKMGRLRAHCLSDQVPVMTAYGNDEGWGNMYANMLRKYFNPEKDVAVGISCSGSSENVIWALKDVIESGGSAAGLTGIDNDSGIHLVGDIRLVHARVPDIRVQEDIHSMVCHALARGMQEGE